MLICFQRNELFKNYVIFWGKGGGHQKITLYYKGGGGRSRESKKGLCNFEWSLTKLCLFNTLAFPCLVLLQSIENNLFKVLEENP